MEICPKCGLPSQACVCEQIVKSSQKIKITTQKKRYGKIMTLIEGFDKDIDIKKISKRLKNKLACGGTYKGNLIELQGDHKEKAKEILEKELGFEKEMIE
ncbi:MAG: stress response translation initiation inhibitor YciH [Minisyncoccales bacterium]